MKSVVIAGVCLVFLAGCASKDAKPNNSIAKVVETNEECGSKDIKIVDIKGRVKSDGFMKVQVSGENLSDEYQLLEYRVVWFDEDGFVIDSLLSKWQTAPAYAAAPFHVSAISPSTKAKTFRLYIRRDKEVICEQQDDTTDGY